MEKRLSYSWTVALPFLLTAAVAALQALLTQLTAYHPSTATGALLIALALPVGDAIRAALLSAQAKNQQPAAPVGEILTASSGAITLPALPVVDPALLVGLVEDALRQHLAGSQPSITDPPSPDPAIASTIHPPPARTPQGQFTRKVPPIDGVADH